MQLIGQPHQLGLTGLESDLEVHYFETPVASVSILECNSGGADLLQVFEDAPMSGLFHQCPVEPLGDAIGLGLGDEGIACRYPRI
nr:hypothetical protein [Caballeronia sordidicola]